MSSSGLTLHTNFNRQHWLHGRHRRLMILGIAGLLIVALVLGIRGVSATHPSGDNSNAVTLTPVTDSKGASMDQAGNTTNAGDQNVSSHSVSSQVNTTTSGDGQSTTSVMVNGKPVAVPASGELHQTINDGNGTTQIDISNGSSSDSSSSSVNVQVSGSTSSSQ